MRSTCLLLLTLATAGTLAAPAPFTRPVAPNLLVNGSFEEGPKAVFNYFALGAGSKTITGWEVTRASVDLVDGYWQAAQGRRSIDLHGSPGLGGIRQSFATVPGQLYLVRFGLAGNPDGAVNRKVMAVSAAGKSASFTTACGTRPAMNWRKCTWRFRATAKRTTLEFRTLMTNDTACGPVLDDVHVSKAR